MNTTAERIIQVISPPASVIELLVVGCPTDDANLYAQTLRNSGMAVRLSTVDTQDALDEFLKSSEADIVLVNCDAEEVDFTTAIRQIRRQFPTASFILLSDDPAGELFFAAETGAQDIIERRDHAHLIYAVHREQQNILTRKELLETRATAEEIRQRWHLLTEEIEEPVAYVQEGIHLVANPAYVSLFGYDDADEMEGLPFMDLIAPDDRLKFKPVLRMLEKQKIPKDTRVDCLTSEGNVVSVEMRFALTHMDGEPATQVIARDLSMSNLTLDELAHYDLDTKLYNRHFFQEELEKRYNTAKKHGQMLSLLLFDLTNYSELTEKNGNDPANKLLVDLAQMIKESTYESDLLARFGEHQFALACTPSTNAKALAKKLIKKATQLGAELSMEPRLAVGLAYSNAPATENASELLHNAQVAANHALESGKSMVLFDESLVIALSAAQELNQKLVRLINRALEEKDLFVPFYQPLVSLQGNSREHYVVFLRLRNEDGELMLPEEFIPEAEKAGRMADIDRWTIRRAIQELAGHRATGHRINFLINLSGEAITDDSLLLWICDCLREFKAKGAWLTFVVSQQDVIRHLDAMEQLADGLRKINCHIALSHVAYDQESLNLAKHLSVDLVYFPTDTAANISRDKKYLDILKEYHDQLQQAGIKTVVTWIEEAAQLALLWNVGVDYTQGNFIQEPVDSIVYDAEL